MIGRPATFRARLTVRWTAVFGVLLALANGVVYVAVRTYTYRDLDAKVRTLAATETVSSTDGPIGLHVHELPVEELGLVNFTEKFVQIYTAAGELTAASAFPGMETAFVPREVVAAGLAGEAPQARLSVLGKSVRIVVLPASRDGQRYAIAVGLVTDDIDSSLGKLAWLLVTVWCVGLLATAAVGFRLASSALRPVDALTRRAGAIARGEVETALEVPPVNDEIGRMTTALNGVLARLQRAVDANRRFASDAAHELRGPITSMMGEIDVALRHERRNEEYRDTLVLLRERLRTFTSLTEDLMLLVRTHEGDRTLLRKEIEVGAIVRSSMHRLEPIALARGVRISVEALPACVIYGDERLLARAFDNVLENAVRYNRAGGLVTITAAVHDPRNEAEPVTVAIRVEDSGPGIPPADWERVFERFYRVDQSRSRHTGGRGLGLAITREVLQVFGGTIRVVSSSERGTVMEMRLPGAVRPFDTAARDSTGRTGVDVLDDASPSRIGSSSVATDTSSTAPAASA
ncbi:MAG TPA: ATP-binding protein [Vicinamibacterales bacterium]